MTLLIDPPLLVAAGAAIQRLFADEQVRRRLQVAVNGVTLAAGVAFYANAAWTRPLWPLLRVQSGRDWMLNSWLLQLEHRNPPPVVHAAAAVAFAAYPMWTQLGRRLARERGLIFPSSPCASDHSGMAGAPR